MNTDPKGLQINIMGREFRVACPEEEQKGLLEAVEYLNRKMHEIRDNGKVVGLERIAIMAALNIAHELLSLRNSGDAHSGFDIETLRRRMALMRSALDEALAPPEPLP